MDIYTTAFIYPRRVRQPSPPASHDPHGFNGAAAAQEPEALYTKADVDAVQAMVNSATASSGCHITCKPNQNRWDFMVTGAYQQVMMARGTIMRDCPTKVRVQSCESHRRSTPNSSTRPADPSIYQSPSL
jgi:hypothetical protein